MITPQLEKVPDYVLSNGRKDLTDEVYSELYSVIDKLRAIKGPRAANALNHIGVIQAFLNEYEDALYSFEDSWNRDFTIVSYINYLTTLERLGQYNKAFDEGIAVLCSNPNVYSLFELLFDLSKKYIMVENFGYLKHYESYLKVNPKNIDISKKIRESEITLLKDNELLKSNNIKLDYYQKIINIAFCEVRKISHSELFLSTKTNDLGEFCKNIQCDLTKSDIRKLNSSFDKKIEEAIHNGLISYQDYLFHMDKLFIGYQIKAKFDKVCA